MFATVAVISLLALSPHQPAVQPTDYGWLWPDSEQPEKVSPFVYTPQEGDLIFFTTRKPFYVITYGLARSSHPYHSAIVVRNAEGVLSILESGGDERNLVTVSELAMRLNFHHNRPPEKLPISWVRQIRRPLTAEQSQLLTAFAYEQDGKRFTNTRELTKLLLPDFLRKPTTRDQEVWFCSELLAAALKWSHITPADAFEPAHLTPRDMMLDRHVDLRCSYRPAKRWSPTPCNLTTGPHCAPK